MLPLSCRCCGWILLGAVPARHCVYHSPSVAIFDYLSLTLYESYKSHKNLQIRHVPCALLSWLMCLRESGGLLFPGAWVVSSANGLRCSSRRLGLFATVVSWVDQ
ncbi:hypothetical protein F4804DRAFT_316900 [Jackrogersella minutella]|nr:hypothetical protein F4804DRAFT_316900 [Jackrogersella minutella]